MYFWNVTNLSWFLDSGNKSWLTFNRNSSFTIQPVQPTVHVFLHETYSSTKMSTRREPPREFLIVRTHNTLWVLHSDLSSRRQSYVFNLLVNLSFGSCLLLSSSCRMISIFLLRTKRFYLIPMTEGESSHVYVFRFLFSF